MIRILIACCCLVLAGCQTDQMRSVAGSECKIFEPPTYAVRGARPYDQDWIDSQVEGGVGGCGWNRPLPRPASFDAVRPVPKVSSPAAKPGLVSRVRARLKKRLPPEPAAAPAPAEPAPMEQPAAVEPAPVASPPDPLDQLLDPSGPIVGKYQDRVQ